MNDSTVSLNAARSALLDHVARCPQGVARSALKEGLDDTQLASFDEAVAQAARAGWVEPSPLYPDRLRWARADGPYQTAAAWVRLRTAALPVLAEIHELSKLPTTLHVLIGHAHTVIERFPIATHADSAEVARYATPRPLTSGITSTVFLACLPAASEAAASLHTDERLAILESGYGFALAADAALGGVLSAPVRSCDGIALAAICTFGAADALSPDRVRSIGRAMASAARSLSELSEADAPLLRRAADAL